MKLKLEKLKGYKNFKKLFKEGIKIRMENFTLYYLPECVFPLRYSLVVSPKYGKAVKRNKLKRQVRSILMTHFSQFLPLLGNLIIHFYSKFEMSYFDLNNLLLKSFCELKKCLKNLY